MTFYRFAQTSKTGRNSRIDSLFNVLGISRERIYNGDVMKIKQVVDWASVDEKLNKLREESIVFLWDALM
jgi:Tfp pilus assembly ATPase PilU